MMDAELYQEVLLQHSRRPRNHGPLETANRRADGHNALCGDELTVEAEVDGGTIRRAQFTASACAICTASASIMTGEVQGLSCEEARELAGDFRKFAASGEMPARERGIASRPRLAALGTVHQFPQRVKCATLPWETLVAAISAEA
jgi:nitrogen fixation NifU-like protein